jgi:hypothetical protein
MALATLLNPDDPMFGFENDQAHQVAHAGSYLLDPDQSDNGMFRQIHQTAHDDMMNPPPANLPQFGEQGGFPSAQNFEDIDYSDPKARAWWTWTHHQEHQLAQQATPSG